jgi:hypothetical protein
MQHYVNDIETGAFELADDIVRASARLLARVPDAQTWFIRIGGVAERRDEFHSGITIWQSIHPSIQQRRIGYQAVYHFGSRSLRAKIYC